MFFFFLPLSLNRTISTWPFVTLLLLFLHALGALLNWAGPSVLGVEQDAIVNLLGFHGFGPPYWQLVSFMLLPGSVLPFIINMIMLFLVGGGLEDRIGHVRMLLFFLAGGAIGAIASDLGGGAMTLGMAPGVAALLGAFCVLMPWAEFRIYYVYFICVIRYFRSDSGSFNSPALVLVALYFLFLLFPDGFSSGRDFLLFVVVHSGFLFGAAAALAFYGWGALFRTEVEEREFLWAQRMRKRQVKAGARNVAPDEEETEGPNPQIVAQLVALGKAEYAETEYRRLCKKEPGATLKAKEQVRLARILAEAGRYDGALLALENLTHSYPHMMDARLSLLAGECAVRTLQEHPERAEEARRYLEQAVLRLASQRDKNRAKRLLAALDHPPAPRPPEPALAQEARIVPKPKLGASLIEIGEATRQSPTQQADREAQARLSPLAFADASDPAPRESVEPPRARPTLQTVGLGESAPIFIEEENAPPPPQLETVSILNVRNSNDIDVEECERLGSQLAAESLRHVWAPDAGFPKVQTTEAPTSPTASFSLILAPAERLDGSLLLRLMAEYYGATPSDAARRLRLQAGILEHDATLQRGLRLRTRSFEAGIGARLVENRPEWDWTEAIEVQGLEITRERWFWRTDESQVSIEPTDISLAACGRIRVVPGSPSAPCQVEFCQLRTRLRLRLTEGVFDLAGVQDRDGLVPDLGAERSASAGMRTLASGLLALAPRAPQTFAMRQWLARPSESRLPEMFRNAATYDNCNRWHLLARVAPEVAEERT